MATRRSTIILHKGIIHKYCSKCKEYCPSSEFFPAYKSTIGMQGYCKNCMRLYKRE